MRMVLEVENELYQLLQIAAQLNQLSLEDECLRRLDGGQRRSRYLQALVAELRADDEQRRQARQ
ncbi:hypothetical protein NLK61_06645 [Pseudomonas fuscovaginae UPB0736]|uniref:Uncharacterized protein n=3 Tax=Pseudomonas asplenii TaxID=53407 RepID=A0A1H1ND88_9PSED|nr:MULTISPECIES: hypothetical protein [Pseudomonas]UUQ66314.1 hypothetical protein NLK61_06645 [Pseudomonas fuscovaginae UPB0736]UZE30464.1 hypothetical protein LOY63_06925 [Pseudomonas asplenii]SDR96877.1 hypothetical protein SAMN05216598_0100 [Pseudomonas asplenii]